MERLIGLLTTLAVLALVLTGLAHLLGAQRASERLAQAVVACLGAALAMPLLATLLASASASMPRLAPGSIALPRLVIVTEGWIVLGLLVIVGHLVLGVAILRRRARADARVEATREHATSVRRRRERLAPPFEDER